MDRDSALDQMPPPIPTATHEILGGGGLKLHAREWGNPGGPALLFIHGWSQSDLCWLNQVRGGLAGTSRIVTFDLRGHGLSDKPLQAGIRYADGQLWADDVAAVIDQAGLEQPTLVAWSYGGYIVADYLRAYGDTRIGGINLVGAGLILRAPRHSTTSVRECSRTHRKCVFPTCSRTPPRPSASCAPAPPGRSTTMSWTPPWHGIWSCHPQSAARCSRVSSMAATPSRVRSSVPVLVTHGQGDDMIILPSMAEHTLTVCPAATGVVVRVTVSATCRSGRRPIASTVNSPTSRTPRGNARRPDAPIIRPLIPAGSVHASRSLSTR